MKTYNLFVLMKYGYSQGTHTADNAESRKDQCSHVLTVCKQTMFWVKGYMLWIGTGDSTRLCLNKPQAIYQEKTILEL